MAVSSKVDPIAAFEAAQKTSSLSDDEIVRTSIFLWFKFLMLLCLEFQIRFANF